MTENLTETIVRQLRLARDQDPAKQIKLVSRVKATSARSHDVARAIAPDRTSLQRRLARARRAAVKLPRAGRQNADATK